MSQILYPDQRLPRTKDFLKEHVINIRKTAQDNRQKQLENKENELKSERLRASLLKNTLSRYKQESSTKSLVAPEVLSDSALRRHSSFGRVPSYIRKFESEKKSLAETAAREAEEAKIPKGCRYMTMEERQSSIADITQTRSSLLDELKNLPLTSFTLKQRRRKLEIDLKLSELEKLHEKLQSNKVLIRTDTS